MNDFDSKGIEFKREMLREALNMCRRENINTFNRMYGGVESIEENKMSRAYVQIQRTLKKNADRVNADE